MKEIVGLIAIIIFIAFLMLLIHTQDEDIRDLKSTAITLDYAEYNPTNTQWQWKTNKEILWPR